MFGSLGFTELILILFIVLIIFGAGKLPQLGEGIGKAIKGFKKSAHEADGIEAEAQAAQQNMAAAPPQQAIQEPTVQAPASVEQPAAPVHSVSRG
jgi:sec-independent protein translocase protein TatA